MPGRLWRPGGVAADAGRPAGDAVAVAIARQAFALVDVFAFSGDAGTQRAPLIGPDIYEEMLLPHFRRVTEHIHNHTPAKFFYHTCGSVYRLIPSFMKLGVDILNPLQVTAADMEAERLVNEFGGNLVFWGGGIDAQQTLIEGNQEQVRDKVRKQLAQFTRYPGYVFAFDHNIQHDVPPENVVAAIDEARTFRLPCNSQPDIAGAKSETNSIL